MPSEGAPGPSNLFADDAEDDGVVLRTTLRRASTGKFNLVFKHDSKTGEVAISQRDVEECHVGVGCHVEQPRLVATVERCATVFAEKSYRTPEVKWSIDKESRWRQFDAADLSVG